LIAAKKTIHVPGDLKKYRTEKEHIPEQAILFHDLKTKILLVKMTQYEIIYLLFHEITVCGRKSKMIDPKSKNLKYRWSYVCPLLNNQCFFRLFLLLHFVIRHHVFTQN